MMRTLHYAQDTTLNMESTAFPSIVYQKSLLGIHNLPAHNLEIRQKPVQNPDWIFAVLTLCFILLAWNHVFNPKRFKQVMRAPFSKRFINQLVREGNLFNERIAFTLGVVYLLTFSLLVFLVNERFLGITLPTMPGILTFVAILIALLAYTTAKVTLLNILGTVFRTRETTYNYLLNLMIFAIITGPVILFFLVLIVYISTPILVYICLTIMTLLFIFRFIRGFLIGMALTKFSYLLLFVYLCSLEILPLLVLLKFILDHAETAVV